MGRPLNKKYFGNRNIGSSSVTTDNGLGGEGIASITFGGTNNSTGFTDGSTTQVTFPAPDLAGGVTAVATITTHAAGALTNKTTYNTFSGTSVTAAATYTGVTQKVTGGTSGSGTGAVFTITKTGSGTSYSGAVTVTMTSEGSGYALNDTITISGALLGGVVTTNDFTFAIKTFVATTGTIKSIEITEKGSGYTSIPTVSTSTGTIGTLTLTAVLTTDSGSAGSSTNQENAIKIYAVVQGGNRSLGDVVKQVNDRAYKVKTDDGTQQKCVLKTSGNASSVGEADITAYDSDGGEYYVYKLTSRKVVLVPKSVGGGTQFALNSDGTAKSAKWVFRDLTVADANNTVKIDNA